MGPTWIQASRRCRWEKRLAEALPSRACTRLPPSPPPVGPGARSNGAAGDAGVASGAALKPISVPMTVVRRASGGFVGMVATGGADWLKSEALSGVEYHVYGIDLASDSASAALFTLSVPRNDA